MRSSASLLAAAPIGLHIFLHISVFSDLCDTLARRVCTCDRMLTGWRWLGTGFHEGAEHLGLLRL